MPDINVKNLYVLLNRDGHSFGEYGMANGSNPSIEADVLDKASLVPLVQQIELFATFADEYHKQFVNGTNKHQTESKRTETVTRILTNEFSLYTKYPMNLETFSELVQSIKRIAQTKQQNVHLLLSSFAVVDNKNQLLNVTLYVTCGPNPQIHAVLKSIPAETDPDYNGKYRLFKANHTQNTKQPFDGVVSELKDAFHVTNGLFILTTAGGMKYTQCVEVCLEHGVQRAKKLFINHPEASRFPLDQLLTSNIISTAENAQIAPVVTHIDAFYTPYLVSATSDAIDLEALKRSFGHFPGTGIERHENGDFIVTKPPFGAGRFSIRVENARAIQAITAFRKPLLQTFPKAYSSLWNRSKDIENRYLLKAKALLTDYTKNNSWLMRLLTGHWNRHHIKEANALVRGIENGSIGNVIVLHLRFTDIKLKNAHGSLARRFGYIMEKMRETRPNPTDPVP